MYCYLFFSDAFSGCRARVAGADASEATASLRCDAPAPSALLSDEALSNNISKLSIKNVKCLIITGCYSTSFQQFFQISNSQRLQSNILSKPQGFIYKNIYVVVELPWSPSAFRFLDIHIYHNLKFYCFIFFYYKSRPDTISNFKSKLQVTVQILPVYE